MSKELEIVRKLQHCGVEEYRVALEQVEKILLEYEQIKNANPSEALEDLDKMVNQVYQVDDDFELYHDKVKQTLLKAQEQEKVLEIIKKKCVGNDNLYLVKTSINYKQYLGTAKLGIDNIVNINLKENDLLTQEEFELLKRC